MFSATPTKFVLRFWVLFVMLSSIGCAHHETIKDKVVVVTGASSGFGKGVAQQLASQGAHVVLGARRTELIEQLAHEAGGGAVAVTTDVSKEDDVERLAQAALSKFGRIDVWINNAGVGAFGRFEDVPMKEFLPADRCQSQRRHLRQPFRHAAVSPSRSRYLDQRRVDFGKDRDALLCLL